MEMGKKAWAPYLPLEKGTVWKFEWRKDFGGWGECISLAQISFFILIFVKLLQGTKMECNCADGR